MSLLLLPFAITLLAANSTSAATITFDAYFATSHSGPLNPVTGSFRASFDNSMSFVDRTDFVELDALNIRLDSQVGASYFAEYDVLLVGGTQDGVASVAQNSYDFWLVIANVSNAPIFGDPFGGPTFVYTQGGFFHFVHDVVGVIEEVPEPGALALLGLGLAGVGLTSRRKAH
jgi:hypothetical protein